MRRGLNPLLCLDGRCELRTLRPSVHFWARRDGCRPDNPVTVAEAVGPGPLWAGPI